MKKFEQFHDDSFRILAKGYNVSNDQFVSGLNGHDMIIGASCAGKTGNYVIPNILVNQNSMVLVDTKGTLYARYGRFLKKKGFTVRRIDFVNPENSETFNPLMYVDVNSSGKGYKQKDLKTIATMLIHDDLDDEKIWVNGARMLLEALMAYVMEVLVEADRNMASVAKLYQKIAPDLINDGNKIQLFEDLRMVNPDSFAVSMYDMFRANAVAEKMMASFSMFVSAALEPFVFDDLRTIFAGEDTIDFAELGRKKTVLFVDISDTDRSMDNIIGVFYQQLFQSLTTEADSHDDRRLKVPVRIILDDFACNFVIPDFDKMIPILRSRLIYVSLILQDYSQLETMYDVHKAKTIFNNCDCKIFMGWQDKDTARFVADMAGCLPETVMKLRTDQAYVLVKGKDPVIVEDMHPYEMEVEFGL